MSDIVAGTQRAIDELITPDLKAIAETMRGLNLQVDGLRESMDARHDSLMKMVEEFRAEMRAEFASFKQQA